MGAKTRLRMRPSKRKYSKYARRVTQEVRTEMHRVRSKNDPRQKGDQAISKGSTNPLTKGSKVPANHRRAA